MTLIVGIGDPRSEGATALLQQSHALMESLFPAEDNHFLSIDALCTPDIHFYIARENGEILGTGALAERAGYGELKSMFTSEAARGQGVADALLRALEDHARALGLPAIRLETGDSLHAAHRLYARHGFELCGSFGDYTENPTSIFMEKVLS